jgi:hypothetical protein
MAGRAAPKPLQTQQFSGQASERPFCATVGCEQRVLFGQRLCQACDERERNEKAMASNRARGLTSVDEMRAYCRRMLKRGLFGDRPSFERWAENITQGTVERLLLMGGKDDGRVLERLRNMGVIDEQNRVVPVDERGARRAALEAARKADRERIEAVLAAQGVVRKTVDTEAAS